MSLDCVAKVRFGPQVLKPTLAWTCQYDLWLNAQGTRCKQKKQNEKLISTILEAPLACPVWALAAQVFMRRVVCTAVAIETAFPACLRISLYRNSIAGIAE